MTEVSLASAPAPVRAGVPAGRRRALWLLAALCAGLLVTGLAVALAFRGRSQEDRLTVALVALEKGDFSTARLVAQELRESPAQESEAKLLRGATLLKRGHFYPALDDLQQIKDSPELEVRKLALTGQAWYHVGRHVEAQQALQEVLKREPDSVNAHRWLAASFYDLGAIHDALFHLKKTAELDPADHRPHRLLGLIYKDFERYDDAVPCYAESLRRKADQPDWVQVRQEMAACQLRLRLHRDALNTLSSCPNSTEIDVVRAECHLALGESALAQEAVARANADEPDHLEVLMLRGTIMLEEGNAPRAAEILARATHKYPMDYLAHLKLSQAFAQAQKPKQAEAEQKVAEEIRKIREEFAQLHQVAWDQPRDPEVRLRLAALAQQLRRPDLADVWLKSAAALAPLTARPPDRPQPQTGQLQKP